MLLGHDTDVSCSQCLHLVSASLCFWAARVDGGREEAENVMDFYEVVEFYIISSSPVGPVLGEGKRKDDRQEQVKKDDPRHRLTR